MPLVPGTTVAGGADAAALLLRSADGGGSVGGCGDSAMFRNSVTDGRLLYLPLRRRPLRCRRYLLLLLLLLFRPIDEDEVSDR